MLNQKDRINIEINEKQKEFSKTVHHWLAQYDEEDDFLSKKTSEAFLENTEEQ